MEKRRGGEGGGCSGRRSPPHSDSKHRVDLTWRGLTLTAGPKDGGTRNLILNNVSGVLLSGRLTGLIGPSGSGKTSLLTALGDRLQCGEVRGDIRVNGWTAFDGEIRALSAFIPQSTDITIETLTVTEHLNFMVALRFRRFGKHQREERVRELLRELSLEECRDTRISELSGGEKRRLIFSVEIVSDPMLLFCDEPTTSLDSESAKIIISILAGMAERGRTVLVSIHQPSSQVFSYFSDLILLTEGRVAFSGERRTAETFFNSLNYYLPSNHNPSDFYTRILAGPGAGTAICDSFANSSFGRDLKTLFEEVNQPAFLSTNPKQMEIALREMRGEKPSWARQVRWLTWRSLLDSWRNPAVHRVRLAHKIFTGLMIALCYSGGLLASLDQNHIQNVQGVLFMFLTENTFPCCYAVLQVFPTEIHIFLQEHSGGLYSSSAYYISKIISLIPGFVLEPLIFTCIAYWLIGLRPDAFSFFATASIIIMSAQVSFSYGCVMSATFDTIDTASLLMMPINQILMISGGFYANLRTFPRCLRWLSWLRLSYSALSFIQWQGSETGREILDDLGLDPTRSWKTDLLGLFLTFLILHMIGFLALSLRIRRQRRPLKALQASSEEQGICLSLNRIS